jgi:hypothetical protein
MTPTTQIAIEGDHFVLHLEDNNRKHIVEIPIGRPDKLVALLQARRAASMRIAEPGSPVQSMIDRPTERAAIDTWCATAKRNALAELGL